VSSNEVEHARLVLSSDGIGIADEPQAETATDVAVAGAL